MVTTRIRTELTDQEVTDRIGRARGFLDRRWTGRVVTSAAYAVVRNPRDRRRRLLLGVTHGGRALTLVIDRPSDPTTWLVVTGWGSTTAELVRDADRSGA
jgi:hypothetical protein